MQELRRAIRRWYARAARDLPWRATRDPYAVLVSEIMLQQTQVGRVVPKYREFRRRFPSLRALARAPLADVLRAWSGLGYNRRARMLWECARTVAARPGGRLPRDVEALSALPGIGPYTARAVASIAFGVRVATVDTNVRRVLGRAIDGADVDMPRAWELADMALPRTGAGAWNQALMDVGARFCRPKPRCGECPAGRACRAANAPERAAATPIPRSRTAPFQGSSRFYRGRIVRALARAPSLSMLELGEQVKDGFRETDLPWLHELLARLAYEGLVALDRRRGRARLP